MTVCFRAPDPIQSTFLIPGSNTPGNGVQVFFYQNGTTTKSTVYKDPAAGTAWSNPIVLDSGGNLPNGASVWLVQGSTYTIVYAPASDSDPPINPYLTIDDVSGVNNVAEPAQILVTSFVLTTPVTLVEFNNAIDWSLYAFLDFHILNLRTTVHTSEPLGLFLSADGGATYATSNRFSLGGVKLVSSTFAYGASTTFVRAIPISDPAGIGTTAPYIGHVTLSHPSETTQVFKHVILNSAAYFDATTNNAMTRVYGAGNTAQVSTGISGVAFGMMSSSPISSGIFKVYGTKL